MNKYLILSIPAILVAAAVWWQNSQPPKQTQSLNLTKAWWPAWDAFQMEVQEAEKKHAHFKTTFIQTKDYGVALETFKKPETDAATLTIYEAILAAAEGIPLKIILLLDYTIGSDGVVAKKGIRALTDLKGKRIGVEKGSIGHFTTLKALEQGGVEPEEVTFVNLKSDGLEKAFIAGELDAVGIFEPYMSSMAAKGEGHILFSSREIPRAICDVLFVKKHLLNGNHHEMFGHWLQAWEGGLNKLSLSPKPFLSRLSKLNHTPFSELESSLRGIYLANLEENTRAFGLYGGRGYLAEAVEQMHEFMMKNGVIGNGLSKDELAELLDATFVKQSIGNR